MNAVTTHDTSPLVDIHGVRRVYGRKVVLDDVALTIRPGEVVGLVGPNGAGKTTLIRIISGMSRPTSGQGTVLGREIGAADGRVPFMGLMVERPMFIETMSGRQNLQLLFGIRGGGDDSRVSDVLARVGLDPGDHRPVRSYSLGMRQRLSLAQAIGESPSLVVLDEPTNGLDPHGIVEMRGLVRALADRCGMGVLLTSHLLSEVEVVCDRVVVLSGGRMQRTYSLTADSGRVEMILEVACPEDAARAACAEGVEVVASTGPLSLRIRVEHDVPSAVRALVEAGVGIEALQRDRGGLERAYMEAVRGS